MVAIFHLSVKIIGGGSGRSAMGAAAYRAGEKLYSERDGLTHNYTNRRGVVGAAAYRSGGKLNTTNGAHDFTKKHGVLYSEIMLPEHAPKEYQDRETLWNAVESGERQHNARTAREIVIALPNELTAQQHVKLVQDYVQHNFVNEGMCADFSIHDAHKNAIHTDELNQDTPIAKNNPHAHIMLTVRPINADGTWGAKSKKEYILDKNGQRIKLKSGEWKSRKIDSTDWDKKESLLKWRKNWAITVNREFQRLGIDERIDHRTLLAQGIHRLPTVHLGHEAHQLEKKGIKTRRGDINRAIARDNAEIERIEAKLIFLEKQREMIAQQTAPTEPIRNHIRGFKAQAEPTRPNRERPLRNSRDRPDRNRDFERGR